MDMIYKLKVREIQKKTLIEAEYAIIDESGKEVDIRSVYFNEDTPLVNIEKELARLVDQYSREQENAQPKPTNVPYDISNIKNKIYERKK